MVSIIIPVYNVKDYLTECVNSVLKLKSDVEIILVDDGSTDESGRLCDEFALKDKRIRVVHQENGGLSAARNTGVRNASGDYVMFLDSDDKLDPEATDKLLSNTNSDAFVLMGLYNNYYAEKELYEPEDCDAFLSIEGLIPCDKFLNTVPRDGQSCYMVAVRFVVKREFLIENELFFLEGIYHEDEEWTARLLCRTEAMFVNHSYFYQYRQARPGAITYSTKPKNVFDTLTVLQHALDESELFKDTPYKKEYLLYRAAQSYLNIMFGAEVLERNDRKKIYEKLKEYRRTCVPYLCGTNGSIAKILLKTFGIAMASSTLQALRRIARKLKGVKP